MTRNIKIELELPEFEKELSVSIILKRDGEVTTVTSSPATGILMEQNSGGAWKQHVIDNQQSTTPVIEETKPKKTTKRSGGTTGNMMDMSF